MTPDDLEKMLTQTFKARPEQWNDTVYFNVADRLYSVEYTVKKSIRGPWVQGVRLVDVGKGGHREIVKSLAFMAPGDKPELLRAWIVRAVLDYDARDTALGAR